MIECVGVHRPDQRDVIDTRREMRKVVTQLHAALAMRLKLERAAHQDGGFLLNEREPHVLGHRLGQRLAVQFLQLRLLVEQVNLTRCPFEKDEDARLRLRCKVRLARCERVRRRFRRREQAVSLQHRQQSQLAHTARSRCEKAACWTARAAHTTRWNRNCRTSSAAGTAPSVERRCSSRADSGRLPWTRPT